MSNENTPGLQDALDQMDIRNLISRYCWALDKNDRELFSKVFAPDATAHLGSAQPKCSGGRGLTHSARTAAHDDARGGITQKGIYVEHGNAGHHAIPCSCSMSASS
jgi:hypothetical protein